MLYNPLEGEMCHFLKKRPPDNPPGSLEIHLFPDLTYRSV